MATHDNRQAQAPAFMRLVVIGAALLAVAGGVAFYYATQMARGPDSSGSHEVTITAETCEPNQFTVPAGRQTFAIINHSDRPLEWEILDGVLVVAERENIVPGFRQTVTANLRPGHYAITCGLLSNPRGELQVTPSAAAVAEAARPGLRAFIGPLSEYKVFLVQQSAATIAAAEKLAQAIKAGDLQAARASYRPARLPYKRVAPIAYRFTDLENAINPLADYLAQREEDAAFTGFHRIEYGLFAQDSTAGLAAVADQLVSDLNTLKERLYALQLSPEDLASSAVHLAQQLAQGRLAAGENHYAGTDLSEVEANLEGIAKIVALLNPVVEPAAPDIAADVEARLTAIDDELAGLLHKNAFPDDERQALSAMFQELADALLKINPAIGIS